MFGFPVTTENGEWKLVEGLRDRRLQPGAHQPHAEGTAGRAGRRQAPALISRRRATRRLPMTDWNPAALSPLRGRAHAAGDRAAGSGRRWRRRACVFDLGCGPGNSTELLAAPLARGARSSAPTTPRRCWRARASACRALRFELADIATWQPARGARPDLRQRRAAMGAAGTTARSRASSPRWRPAACWPCRCPTTSAEPSHLAMREVAALPAYAPAIGDARQRAHGILLGSTTYYDLLARDAAQRRRLAHHLSPPDGSRRAPIVDWLRSTGLQPFLDPLSDAQQARLSRRLRAAHRRGLSANAATACGCSRFRASSSLRRGVPEMSEPDRASPARPALRRSAQATPRCRSATTTPASRRA